MIKSFVAQAGVIRENALEYIKNTIKAKGEVVLKEYNEDESEDEDYEYDTEHGVLCYEYFSGEPFNVEVLKICENSIIGRTYEDGTIVEVFSYDWGEGTTEQIADFVAKHYGELK